METRTSGTQVPKLEAPGAGLPFFQGLMLRYLVGPFVAGRANRERNEEAFNRLHEKMAKLVIETPAELRSVPILVPPQRGLEDSSRYWSMIMTLEHVLIVGEGIKGIIGKLASGVSPGLAISTATVKPLGQGDPDEIWRRFQVFSQTCMVDMAPLVQKADLRVTQSHPWFGPFNALQWHWLLSAHGAIHYQQLKRIKEGLISVHG
jgi:hypothetical protein